MTIPATKAAATKERHQLEHLPVWSESTVPDKADAIRKDTSTFVRFDVPCHSKHREFAEHKQKYKGRVVRRGDDVQDDTGCTEVFAEQGASACQVTAAQVQDTVPSSKNGWRSERCSFVLLTHKSSK